MIFLNNCFLGKDEKYYILDFGRVFPPEFPNTFQEVMYNLLRPNLLHHPQIIKKGYVMRASLFYILYY
jgi:hypothetical protein